MADHRRHGRGAVDLTRRQAEILSLAAAGLGTAEIARHLGVSPRTVEGHISVARTRAGARNVTEMVARCYAAGIFTAGPWPPLPGPGAQAEHLTDDPAGTSTSPASDSEAGERRSSGGVRETGDYETPRPARRPWPIPRAQPVSEDARLPADSEVVYKTTGGTADVHHTLIGLTCVSAAVQDAQLQRDALTEAGCARVFEKKVSARKTAGPGMAAALGYLRPGDTLCVCKLDRLGRSVKDVLAIVNDLHRRGIAIQILGGRLAGDYPPASEGKFLFTLMAAFVELERDIIRERTMAGLAEARANGRTGGRATVLDADKLAEAQARRGSGESPAQIANTLGVSRATIYRHLAATVSQRPGRKSPRAVRRSRRNSPGHVRTAR